MNKNYIIEYICYDIDGKIIEQKKRRAKNKLSRFDAKCGLEDFLEKRYTNFGRLYIISCREEINKEFLDTLFGDVMPDIFR